MDVRAVVLVSGRVQGVGFRDFVRRRASALGLAGSATNLRDGRVEVIAEGPREAVDALLDTFGVREAPGRVSGVEVTWHDPQGDTGFAVR